LRGRFTNLRTIGPPRADSTLETFQNANLRIIYESSKKAQNCTESGLRDCQDTTPAEFSSLDLFCFFEFGHYGALFDSTAGVEVGPRQYRGGFQGQA